MTVDWTIIYLRPDGWWSAGGGFEDPLAALEAAQGHKWGGSQWGIIPSDALKDTLCLEGWSVVAAQDGDGYV